MTQGPVRALRKRPEQGLVRSRMTPLYFLRGIAATIDDGAGLDPLPSG